MTSTHLFFLSQPSYLKLCNIIVAPLHRELDRGTLKAIIRQGGMSVVFGVVIIAVQLILAWCGQVVCYRNKRNLSTFLELKLREYLSVIKGGGNTLPRWARPDLNRGSPPRKGGVITARPRAQRFDLDYYISTWLEI